MSGRIRQLKPEFLLDEDFWALKCAHPQLHLHEAFEGLWCHADREGRFEWRPQMLRAKILPYWQGDFERVLEVLRGAGLVVPYEVDGRRYGWVRSFAKHQRPNSREPASVLPAPPERALHPSVSVHARAQAPRASPLPTPDSQPPIPIPTPALAPPAAALEPLESPPEVPGLRVVGAPAPGLLGPSQRERDLVAKAEAVGANGPPRHEFSPGWSPGKSNQARGHELGLTDDEIWARWETCKDKYYETSFRSDVKQFNRELAFAAQDKAKDRFARMTPAERKAFEMPGLERRRA